MKKKLGFFEQVRIGFSSYAEAIAFVFKNNLWPFFFVPLGVFLILIFWGYHISEVYQEEFKNWFFGKVGLDGISEGTVLDYISGIVNGLFSLLIKIVLFFLFSAIGKFLLLILLSPMMGYLSERTEEIITGNHVPFSFSVLIKNALRGSLIALRNMFYQTLIVLLCLAICWIPFIGLLSPIILLFTGYYFYGFSMMDYVNERRKLGVRASVRVVRDNRSGSITNGFMFALIFAIPVLGFIFAPVIAPVAACIAMLEIENK